MQKFQKSFPRVQKLPAGYKNPDDGGWAVASLEVVDRQGDIVRVSGIDCPVGIPLQAQHLAHGPSGEPTTIGKIVEVRKDRILWDNEMTPALLCRFRWAPSKLAEQYRELWPEWISAVSLGAWIKDSKPLGRRGLDVIRSEMYELSICTTGANQGATALKGLSFDDDGDELSQEECDELEASIEELKLRVSILSVEQRLEELKKELA